MKNPACHVQPRFVSRVRAREGKKRPKRSRETQTKPYYGQGQDPQKSGAGAAGKKKPPKKTKASQQSHVYEHVQTVLLGAVRLNHDVKIVSRVQDLACRSCESVSKRCTLSTTRSFSQCPPEYRAGFISTGRTRSIHMDLGVMYSQ